LGNLFHVQLSAGNVHDIKIVEDILSYIQLAGITVLIDKAYGAWQLRDYVADYDADFCITLKVNEDDPWF